MIEFQYTDTYTTITHCNLIEKREIKQILSAKPDGYVFSPKYKKGWWDGNVSLLDKQNRFPSGLLNTVLAQLDGCGYNWDVVNISDWQPQPNIPSNYIPGYELRVYQLQAINKAINLERGVLKMATNAGKTLVIAAIIKATEYQAVAVVPNKALLVQTANELEQMLGMEIGQYGGGKNIKLHVTVTTMASLKKLAKTDLSQNNTLILDECHHTKSDQVFDTIFSIPGKYRIGMSGTPLTHERLSDLKLVGATGDIIYEINNASLIDEGFSSKPLIMFYKLDEPITDKAKKDYHLAYELGIVYNAQRNQLIANTAHKECNRGPVLVICNWVAHVDNIASLNSNFLTATGSTPRSELEYLLEQFNNSNDVLVVSPIFGEGVNIPSVATVILASGNKSHIQLLQRIGRGLRRTDSKDIVHVYDFLDGTNRYLLKHSEERYKLYKSEGFDISLISH